MISQRAILTLQSALPLLLVAGAASGQVTERVNVAWNGGQANGMADMPQAGHCISADGRYVVFASGGSNLVPGDTGAHSDIFVRDRVNRTNERVSVDSSGAQANGHSGDYGFTMTPDARFVAFYSAASNLVPGDTNGAADVFLRDRLLGTTERISLDSNGTQGNARSEYPSLSDDGRFVAFDSDASNLVAGDTNGVLDIFVRDRWSGTTERASVSTYGLQSNGHSMMASMSADGRSVAFHGGGSGLVVGDTNGFYDVFVHDRITGTTERASVSDGGTQGDLPSSSASISADGRFVAFTSLATTLVGGDTNAKEDIFVHDRRSATTARVTVASDGGETDKWSSSPAVSSDGRHIAFMSAATNLVPGITAGGIFVHDLATGTTEYASPAMNGVQANGNSVFPSISNDGRYVVFRSFASNLVPGDTNFVDDVFLHDRFASGFTSLCEPGSGGVISCPCNNKPSEPGRGCDNSAATGGATLSAGGSAYLSIDSLVFTTRDERPNATSLLLQGDASIPTGLVFGQGVRCAGGTLKRLYLETAVNGSITAPDSASGDPTVSARSAALGTPIQPGVPYFYLVYYRDPLVPNGCPASSTFNATQTGQVCWWP